GVQVLSASPHVFTLRKYLNKLWESCRAKVRGRRKCGAELGAGMPTCWCVGRSHDSLWGFVISSENDLSAISALMHIF
ncbi:hypothetical protein, partial [Paludibacterium sp.]|uniref:hypothetical protein n=1 Tax=Paludibacterium sp. TaxID=1917523 RepID=UPI0025DA6D4D